MKSEGRKLSRTSNFFIALVALLVVIRIILPYIALHIVNYNLGNRLGEYTGHVNDLSIRLYRGAYQLHGLEIKKKNSALLPLLAIDTIDLSLAWRALWHKKITADITLKKAVVRIVDSKEKEKRQIGTEESKETWQDVFDVLIPISIETLKIQNSAFYFSNRDFANAMPLRFEQIEFSTEDLRNRKGGVPLSPFTGKAMLQGKSALTVNGQIDVLSKPYRLYLAFELPHFDVHTLNSLLMIYIPIDIHYAELSIYGELASANDRFKGYTKVFLTNGDIIAPDQKFVSVKHFFYEILGGLANWILHNTKTHSFAMYIPFEKKAHQDFDVKSGKAFWSAIKNKFHHLPKGLDHSVSIKDVS